MNFTKYLWILTNIIAIFFMILNIFSNLLNAWDFLTPIGIFLPFKNMLRKLFWLSLNQQHFVSQGLYVVTFYPIEQHSSSNRKYCGLINHPLYYYFICTKKIYRMYIRFKRNKSDGKQFFHSMVVCVCINVCINVGVDVK